jgi:hypothetical protein
LRRKLRPSRRGRSEASPPKLRPSKTSSRTSNRHRGRRYGRISRLPGGLGAWRQGRRRRMVPIVIIYSWFTVRYLQNQKSPSGQLL